MSRDFSPVIDGRWLAHSTSALRVANRHGSASKNLSYRNALAKASHVSFQALHRSQPRLGQLLRRPSRNRITRYLEKSRGEEHRSDLVAAPYHNPATLRAT